MPCWTSSGVQNRIQSKNDSIKLTHLIATHLLPPNLIFRMRKISLPLISFFLCAVLSMLIWSIATVGYGKSDYGDLVDDIIELAEQGDAQAQFSLGMIYDEGMLLPGNKQLAVFWLTSAAEQRLPAAALYLGMKYAFGNGVARDEKVAEHWLILAAGQGWAQAQYLLAQMYLDQGGESRERLRATAWLQLAAASGYPGAAEQVDKLVQTMTDSERQTLARFKREFEEAMGKGQKHPAAAVEDFSPARSD